MSFIIDEQMIKSICQSISQAATLSMFINMTSRFNATELFDKISQSEEFIKFLEINKDKTGKDIFKEFVQIQLYQYLDDKVSFIMNDEKLCNIFNNKSLSSDDQLSIFVGKSLIKYLESSNDNKIMKQLKDQPEFKSIVKDTVTYAKILTNNKVIKSPQEFYHIVVNYCTDLISNLYYPNIDVLKLNGMECESIDPIYESCIGMIDQINTLLASKSKYGSNKRPHDDDDDNKDPKRPRK